MSNIPNFRKFLLASYHDLPNILFVGSLLLGAMMGYLPLVWVALGLVLNGVVVSFLQSILNLLFVDGQKGWSQLFAPSNSPACVIGFQRYQSAHSEDAYGVTGDRRVAPSHWLAAATFFAVFSIYNSIRVTIRTPAPNTDRDKVNIRRAFSISAIVIGIVFMGLVLLRSFTGCETMFGGITGTIVGGGMAIGYWHLLDFCGTGQVPDILQVIGSMAPEGISSDTETPVLCTPPPKD